MGALFIFIFISILIISALLFFNKGEKAQEIKSILKEIYENFKQLFSNLKKLFLILKDLIQTKLNTEPDQQEDKATLDNPLKSDSSDKSTSLSSLETNSLDLTSDTSESMPEVTPETETISTNELGTNSLDLINEKRNNTKND